MFAQGLHYAPPGYYRAPLHSHPDSKSTEYWTFLKLPKCLDSTAATLQRKICMDRVVTLCWPHRSGWRCSPLPREGPLVPGARAYTHTHAHLESFYSEQKFGKKLSQVGLTLKTLKEFNKPERLKATRLLFSAGWSDKEPRCVEVNQPSGGHRPPLPKSLIQNTNSSSLMQR